MYGIACVGVGKYGQTRRGIGMKERAWGCTDVRKGEGRCVDELRAWGGVGMLERT